MIVGAGPVGLFAVFELGLLGMKCEIVDSLAHPGGQCTELYPDKPIYDIPALPVCGAQELIDRLLEQIKPFHAGFHLGQEVAAVARQAAGRFAVETAAGTRFDAGSIIIAGGLGSFQPRRLMVPDAERFEGTQLLYRVRRAEDFHGKDVLVAGGGDSALDWVLEFCGKARCVDAGAPARGVSRAAGVGRAHAGARRRRPAAHSTKARSSRSRSTGRPPGRRDDRSAPTSRPSTSRCELVLACFGLHPKLGPIANWGLALEKKALKVDTEKFQTSEPGIFAIGDINTYPGKKKLILSGFHEAALAAFGVQHHVYPEKRQFLQYTTTSPIMRERLGVAPPE